MQAKAWRRKFIGLLPEIQSRGIHEKHGFFSIYEYAAKLGGVSKKQVQRVIQLERKLETKPQLKSILTNGEISTNKLIKITPILDLEKEESLIEKVKTLPCRTLETYVRDLRRDEENWTKGENKENWSEKNWKEGGNKSEEQGVGIQNGLLKPKNGAEKCSREHFIQG